MFILVADLFSKDYQGGAELTTNSLVAHSRVPIICIYSHQLSRDLIEQYKDRHWIFGNYHNVPTDILLECCKSLEYSVLEYDYKYCKERLPEKHIDKEGECLCENSSRGKMISVFMSRAQNNFFMSKKQMEKYFQIFPFLQNSNCRVLSSVFSPEKLLYMKSLDTKNKNNKYLIQNSNSWVKGTQDAIRYAKENSLDYELFSEISHEEVLKKFSEYKGFIFLPQGPDTCPRTVIEARILGCDLILNDNVQHKDEDWFSNPVKTYKYMISRRDDFWESIYSNSNTRLPKKSTNEERTHFKIVIPVYNSEKWISNTIKSVLKQNYQNYQCIISDDISTDKTYEISKKMISGKSNFLITKNNSKKYALKNIYDSIEASNPSGNDVVVVLDGDDWLSNNNVLSKLNEYYMLEDTHMTFGSFVEFPTGQVGMESSEYPKEVVDNNTYRETQWRASHLKTFRYFLWNKIEEADLKDSDGNFYEISYDQAMMLPMLEMAGSRAKYVPEVLCVYNTGNPNAVNKTRQQKQYETMLEIRAKRKYKRLKT